MANSARRARTSRRPTSRILCGPAQGSSEAEETPLLNAAPPMMRAMIIVALDTGMTKGENARPSVQGHRLDRPNDHAAGRDHEERPDSGDPCRNATIEVRSRMAPTRRLESGQAFTSASHIEPAETIEFASIDKLRQDNELNGGPPGDRTRDTVIKSHVLYH